MDLPPLVASSLASALAIIPLVSPKRLSTFSYVGLTIGLSLPARTRFRRSPGGMHLARMQTVVSPRGMSFCRPKRIAAWNIARRLHPSGCVHMKTRSNSIPFGSTPMERLVVVAMHPNSHHAIAGSFKSSHLLFWFVSPWYGFTGTLHSS